MPTLNDWHKYHLRIGSGTLDFLHYIADITEIIRRNLPSR